MRRRVVDTSARRRRDDRSSDMVRPKAASDGAEVYATAGWWRRGVKVVVATPSVAGGVAGVAGVVAAALDETGGTASINDTPTVEGGVYPGIASGGASPETTS